MQCCKEEDLDDELPVLIGRLDVHCNACAEVKEVDLNPVAEDDATLRRGRRLCIGFLALISPQTIAWVSRLWLAVLTFAGLPGRA